jgi:Ca-activated chloride channel family protein
VLLLLPTPRAHAFDWASLWHRPDQRGYEALQQQQNERAAQLFEDPQWRSAAQYRAQKFPESATSLTGIDTPDGNYNRGNALVKAGQLEDAIAAYDRALELDPQHADAAYNRDLVKDYLEKHPPPQKQDQPQGGQQKQNQNQDQQGQSSGSKGDDQQSNDQAQSRGDQEREQSSGDSKEGNGQDSPNQRQPGDEEQNGQQQQAANDQSQQQEQGRAADSKDAEHWADEQAAEQWLRRIPQDPGGLLRRKFLYQYQRLGVDQDGKPVANDSQAKPW